MTGTSSGEVAAPAESATLAGLPGWVRVSALGRLGTAGALGVLAGAVAAGLGAGRYAPITGWDAAAALFLVWTWTSIWPRDAAETRALARREQPSRAAADLVLLGAAVASLLAVAVVIFGASHSKGSAEIARVGLGVTSVVLSWAVVHSVFALTYARLFYQAPAGGVDFNDNEPPRYSDFAYLSFTVGMTFQVSDTQLTTPAVRATVLRQALIAFGFGTVILALTINLVAGLSK